MVGGTGTASGGRPLGSGGRIDAGVIREEIASSGLDGFRATVSRDGMALVRAYLIDVNQVRSEITFQLGPATRSRLRHHARGSALGVLGPDASCERHL